jgi:hypothetical protein
MMFHAVALLMEVVRTSETSVLLYQSPWEPEISPHITRSLCLLLWSVFLKIFVFMFCVSYLTVYIWERRQKVKTFPDFIHGPHSRTIRHFENFKICTKIHALHAGCLSNANAIAEIINTHVVPPVWIRVTDLGPNPMLYLRHHPVVSAADWMLSHFSQSVESWKVWRVNRSTIYFTLKMGLNPSISLHDISCLNHWSRAVFFFILLEDIGGRKLFRYLLESTMATVFITSWSSVSLYFAFSVFVDFVWCSK